AVVGSYRGGWQIAFAGLKIPLALLATLAVCAPAFHAVAAGVGRPWPFRSIVALAVAAAGRSSLCLLAFAPALWLAMSFRLGYHASALAAALAYGVAGLAALGILVRGLGGADANSGARHATTATFLMLFLADARLPDDEHRRGRRRELACDLEDLQHRTIGNNDLVARIEPIAVVDAGFGGQWLFARRCSCRDGNHD